MQLSPWRHPERLSAALLPLKPWGPLLPSGTQRAAPQPRLCGGQGGGHHPLPRSWVSLSRGQLPNSGGIPVSAGPRARNPFLGLRKDDQGNLYDSTRTHRPGRLSRPGDQRAVVYGAGCQHGPDVRGC